MKMRFAKLFTAVVISILALSCMTFSAFAYEVVVWDDAQLFTDSEYNEIYSKAEELSSQADWNVMILTYEGDPGDSVMNFTDNSYESEFGVNMDGVCIVLNPSNPDETQEDVYLGTYGSAITLITDNRVNAFLDAAFPFYDNYEDAKAVKAGLGKLSKFVKDGVYDDAIVVDGYYDDTLDYAEDGGISVGTVLISLLIGCAVGGISAGGVAASYKFHRSQSASVYLDKSHVNMYISEDNFIRETRTKVKIDNDSSSSGGGHSSSSHSTSGGGRAGGGGRSSSKR